MIVVIDPACHTPELECFNRLALTAPMRCTYHLPAMFGMQSLHELDVAQARAFIVLGSAASVHDRQPWQAPLEAWLRPHLERGVPTLGICYGHQMIAYMYGGKIDFLSQDRVKRRGVRRVEFEATPCWRASSGDIVVSHNEIVVAAPSTMRIVGRSKDVAVDALAHASLPIWTMQPHPETVPAFLKNHDIPAPKTHSLTYGYDLVSGFLTYAASRTP